MPLTPTKELVTFENKHPYREYTVEITAPEFTCLCPMTSQPDFATIKLSYVPAARCVELKSYKQYLWSFRDEGHFHEDVTNRILNDLVEALQPVRLIVTGEFNVRGGIYTNVTVHYDRDTASQLPSQSQVAAQAG